jgi:DNA polymerase-1
MTSPKSQKSFFQNESIATVQPLHIEYQDISALTAYPLAIWNQENRYYAQDANGTQAKLSESELRHILRSPHKIICADIKPLLKSLYPLELQAELEDIILMAYLINPGERQLTLEAVCSAYGVDYQEDQVYHQLHTIYPIIRDGLHQHRLEEVYHTIERPLLPVLAKMEARGILFDTDKLQQTKVIVENKIADLRTHIYHLAGEEFNLNSPKQLSEILFTKLQLSPKGVKKTGGGSISTSADALENMRDEYEIIDLILQYREVAKLKSTYIDSLPLMMDKNGRIHTNYQQNIAATGRLSSIDPNLQNIPTRSDLGREIKHCFVAPSEWTLMSLDYSQIELRLAAHLSQDKAMLDIFSEGKDFHTATAERVYGVKPEEITKEMRTFAKTINFGILYGMGAVSLARNLKIKRAEAQSFLQKYEEAYPDLHQYMESLKQFGITHRYAQTEYGRIRDLSSIDIRNPRTRALLERIAVNMPIQGLQADIIKLAMIQIDEYVKDKTDIYMLLQVHDELVFEVTKDKVDKYQKDIVRIMESVYKASIPMKVGVTIQDYWG